MEEESLKWAIAREMIIQKYQEEGYPFLFHTQDDLLKLDDKLFQQAWPQLQQLLPSSLKKAEIPPFLNLDDPGLEKQRAFKRLAYLFASIPLKEKEDLKTVVKNTLFNRWYFFGIFPKEEKKLISLIQEIKEKKSLEV